MKISHFTVAARLRVGFGAMLAAVLLVAATGLYELACANVATEHIVQINIRKMELLEEMSDAVHVTTRVVRSLALLGDDHATIERERPKITDAYKRYGAALGELRGMPLDAAGQDYVAKLARFQDEVTPMNDHFLAMAANGHTDAIKYLLDVAGPEVGKWQESIRAYMALQKLKSGDDAAKARAAAANARNLMLALTMATIAIGLLVARAITRSVTVPLSNAVELASGAAAGDLARRAAVVDDDRSETGALLRALNCMNDGLGAIVGQVRTGAHTLAENAAEISQGNLDLSARTERQAGTLQETAAAMEELTTTVRNNADNARTASAMARKTAEAAARGGKVVSDVVEVMTGIESSSSRIVDIISVIDGIAFQTNILALNAAVEAARAGEQGRGFAVVASEVRTLAQRSAMAAHEIKDLIHGSVDQIKSGSALVRDAGTTMRTIVGEIDSVAGIVSEIAEATEQQSVGIEQTYRAISDLDTITQHNTALVEEVAATAASLKSEADGLDEAVCRFQLLEAPDARAATRAPALKPRRAALAAA